MTTTETMNPATVSPTIVSKTEWLQARKALLEEEKALTRERDELARKRRQLPWVKVEQDYLFDGPNGTVRLSDLFDGRSQLVVYHFMFGPDWAQGCSSCSMVADSIDGGRAHLANRDTSLVMVSRAPIDKIEAFRKRMGWTSPWVSSHDNRFNFDFGVSFTAEQVASGEVPYNYGRVKFPKGEAPGVSVFYKNAEGSIFHTYSAYARGLESLLVPYALLDATPKGRDEETLSFPMAWVRHHDRYPEPEKAAGCCHSQGQA